MPYKIALEYDDLSPSHPQAKSFWRLLESIKDHFPQFKVTMFTVPLEIRYVGPAWLTKEEYKPWIKACQTAYEQGWMRFALHGLTHLPMEFAELGYEDAKKRIIVGQRAFKEAELPLEMIFKAPNWALSKEGKQAAEDLGFKVVEDKYYDWNLADNPPQPLEFKDKIIITHGHVQNGDGCNNGIEETMHKIMALPPDTEFYFLSEAL